MNNEVHYIALSLAFVLFLFYFCIKHAIYCTMNIGERIRERRAVLNITQQELAEISGIGLRTIINIENDRGNPSLATLSQIADILGLEIVLQVKKRAE